MNPAAWRKREGLTLRALATKLQLAWSSVRRYETGESGTPTSVALAYEKLSKGDVTAEDLNRVRRKYLAKQQRAEEEGNPKAVAV